VTASILCIDDEPAGGAILEHILTRAGHRTVLVSTAEEALQVVARLPVDLILAEYRAAGFAGFDLLARLKEEGHRIPVILMTDDSRVEHVVLSIGRWSWFGSGVRMEPCAASSRGFAVGMSWWATAKLSVAP
jgi:DNA-binding NtrC family response regulator